MNEVKSPKKPLLYYYFVAMLLVMLFNFIAMPWLAEHQIKEVDYNTFVTMTEQGEVGRVEIQEQSNRILFTSSDEKTVYKTAMVPDDGLVQRLLDAGISTTGEEIEQTSTLVSILAWVLPIIIFVALGQYMSRKMMEKMGGGGNSMMFNMGKSNAKVYVKSAEGIKFDDVAGEDEAKENLTEVVNYLHDPSKYQEIGASMPKGILLVGPPGTGKTMLAKAVAGEANVPFFSMSGSEFVEMFVGVGASRVRDLFEQAKKNAPAIIFIDEIDAVGRQRGAGLGGGHDEREQTLNQLLVEMDGFEDNDSVIVMAATNRSDILDPALLRPGRFDRQILVSPPDVKGREEILKVHTRNKPLAPDVNLKTIAQSTVGFTGAELENLVNEASLLAARKNKKAITRAEMEEAAIKVVAGPEKKSRVVTPAEKRLTAYHEGGHAICTYFCPTQDKVHHVTIIPRGQAGGFTMSIPEKDKSYVSKNEMFENIIVLLGGRVAEKLILDDISTGASNDLERATATARNMVTRYGFSDNLGPVVYGRGEHEVFLGRDYSSTPSYSENVAAEIDNEIRSIVEDAYNDCEKLLREHMDKLELIAHYLMKHEKIDGSNFEKLMKGELDPSEFMDYDVQAAYDQKMTELMGDAYKPADKTDEDENANDDSTAE